MDATKPYFVVGEYWDPLSYTYREMDYNQDAHVKRFLTGLMQPVELLVYKMLQPKEFFIQY